MLPPLLKFSSGIGIDVIGTGSITKSDRKYKKRFRAGDIEMGDSHNVTFKPGKVLDNKWIIIERIGKGAMGEVYRAHQTNLKRDWQ